MIKFVISVCRFVFYSFTAIAFASFVYDAFSEHPSDIFADFMVITMTLTFFVLRQIIKSIKKTPITGGLTHVRGY